MSSAYEAMWEQLNLDLDAHAGLLQALGKFYGDIYLSQSGRLQGMEYLDFVISEVHGLRIKELQEAKAAGRKIVGTFCVFVPEELVLAADAIQVGLCAGAEAAEKILRDTNLNKRLTSLRRAGGSAAVAAEHAEAIIDRLIAHGMRGLGQTGRFTRYGDARIKNCIKYDLVHGYRLVGMKKMDELILLYVGNHDDCDLWIRHNTGIEPVTNKRRNEAISVKESCVEASLATKPCEPEPDYDEELLKKIDERDLRKIFRGLCDG